MYCTITVQDKLNDCYLWNKTLGVFLRDMVFKWRVGGNNHFHFVMLMLTECFFCPEEQMH